MATLTLTSDQVTKINSYFEEEIITPVEGGQLSPRIYTGADGDESIELQCMRHRGSYNSTILKSDKIVGQTYECYTDAAGEPVDPACTWSGGLFSDREYKISRDKVLVFMAAISPNELSVAHKSVIDDMRVVALRRQLGL